jgi:peroxiredoxin
MLTNLSMYNRKSLLGYLIIIVVATLISVTTYAPSTKQEFTRLKTNPSAPEFILQDIQGKQHALSDYRGKVIVVNFWASWCQPCRAEMPSMQRAAEWLAQHDISLIGIGVGETRKSVLQFLQDVPVHFPLLLDSDSEVMQAWSVQTLPTSLIINQEGHIIFLAIGQREWDDPILLEQIRALNKTK